ncbi:hypothetical protein TWF481_005495 [Arthrobotrys musiformis]|uniref:Uncharacterized protein n=1 Tax=Arthrobotrys musiformis TaxID=47236 RepID=A0AAV9WDY4_9PEZI
MEKYIRLGRSPSTPPPLALNPQVSIIHSNIPTFLFLNQKLGFWKSFSTSKKKRHSFKAFRSTLATASKMQLTSVLTIVMVALSGFAMAAPTPIAQSDGLRAKDAPKKLNGLISIARAPDKRDVVEKRDADDDDE